MSPRTSRLLKLIGYPAFTAFAFVLGIYLTFPFDRVQTALVDRLERATDHDVKIGTFRPSWITGVVLEDVTLKSRPLKSEEKPNTYVIERAAARIALLPLLIGKVSVSFQLTALGGEIEGKYEVSPSSKDMAVEWKAEGISLAQISGPLLSKVISLPITGKLKTSGEMALEGGKPPSAEGKISLACVDCKLGDGKSKLAIPGDQFLAQGITLTQAIRLGEFGGDINFKEGHGQIESFTGKSKDLELSLEGGIDLRSPITRSGVKAFLKFKFTDSLRKALSVLELLENQPKLQRAKTSDGFFGIAMTGTLTSLNPYPSKSPPAGMNAPRVSRRPGPAGPRTAPTTGAPVGRAGSVPPPRAPSLPGRSTFPRARTPSLGTVRPSAAGTAPSAEQGSPSGDSRPTPLPPAADRTQVDALRDGFSRTRFRRPPLAADGEKAEGEKGEERKEEPAGEGGGEAKPEAPAEEAPAQPAAEPAAAPEVND
jgi:type II secretion system protein N